MGLQNRHDDVAQQQCQECACAQGNPSQRVDARDGPPCVLPGPDAACPPGRKHAVRLRLRPAQPRIVGQGTRVEPSGGAAALPLGHARSCRHVRAGPARTAMWADAGKESYFTDAFTLFTSQLLFMSWAEYRRWIDIQYPGSVNEDPIFGNYTVGEKGVGYPGGKWFDPMNFAKDEKKFLELQKKEIANGRLAMVAILGIAAQTYFTGKVPLVCLGEHIKNGVNIFS